MFGGSVLDGGSVISGSVMGGSMMSGSFMGGSGMEGLVPPTASSSSRPSTRESDIALDGKIRYMYIYRYTCTLLFLVKFFVPFHVIFCSYGSRKYIFLCPL